jgi:hypothetical protein
MIKKWMDGSLYTQSNDWNKPTHDWDENEWMTGSINQ